MQARAAIVAARGFAAPLLLVARAAPLAGPTGEPEPELRELLKQAIAQSDSFQDRFDAEVWLLDMSGRLKRSIKDDQERLDFLRLLHQEADRADITPELALAVIQIE